MPIGKYLLRVYSTNHQDKHLVFYPFFPPFKQFPNFSLYFSKTIFLTSFNNDNMGTESPVE